MVGALACHAGDPCRAARGHMRDDEWSARRDVFLLRTRVRAATTHSLFVNVCLLYSKQIFRAKFILLPRRIFTTITNKWLIIYIVCVWFVLFCNVLFRFNKLNIRACESWLMKSMQLRAIHGRSKLHVFDARACARSKSTFHICKCLCFIQNTYFRWHSSTHYLCASLALMRWLPCWLNG